MLRHLTRLRILSVAILAGLLIAVPFIGVPGAAQETQLNPGPATPNPVGPTIPPELTQYAHDWPAPMGNLAGTRAAADSAIDSSTVDQLEVAWTWPIEASGTFGGMTAQPLIVADTVFVQDMQSNVFALDRETGDVKWEKRYDVPNGGPNGVAIGYGMVYGGTGDTAQAFALDAETGEEIWRIDLSNNPGEGIDMAPLVFGNTVYISTVPGTSEQFYEGGQKGILYALDAESGAILWSWDTTAGGPTGNLWGSPWINSGGGLWYPPSVDEEGNLYFGTGNPAPWPGVVVNGTPYPNGSSRPGSNHYTNSLVSLIAGTGELRWFHSAKPHDLFDLDFQLTPIITTLTIAGEETEVAIGGGKTGTVFALDTASGTVLWTVAVGRHENDDVTTIPEGETIRVYPGSLGGIETPMAYADGTLFVPVVNRWNEYTSTTQERAQPLNEATGEFVALDAVDGSVKWQVELPKMNVGGAIVANDVVFTSALDGLVRAYDVETGDELWTYQAPAGVNATMAIAGDLLIVPAAGPLLGAPEGTQAEPQLIALKLDGTDATPAAQINGGSQAATVREGPMNRPFVDRDL